MEIININKESGIPLIGLAYIGILTRNNNSLLQIRATTLCNLNCNFWSPDAGSRSKRTRYVVDFRWLLEWVKEIVDYYNGVDWAHIDSVGEPFMYPKLIELVKGLKKIKGVKRVSMITNGSLLNEKNIKLLEESGLDKINISLHSLDREKSKTLFGSSLYDVDKVVEAIKMLKKTKIDVWLTPVYFPELNNDDIEEIIRFAKENNCKLGIQKYEIHKYGRRLKGVKEQTYYHFYKKLGEWEKKFNFKLKYGSHDLSLQRTRKLPEKLVKGEIYNINVKEKGWLQNQMIGVAENRAVTLLQDAGKGKRVKARVIDVRNNIYIAK